MTDFFALLDETRRPWLDPDLLKAKFLARSAQMHPDRVHAASARERAEAADQYAQLNAAFNCLRHPKDRLAHLLQLEQGQKPADLQQMPDTLADTFMALAQLLRQVDAFLAEKSGITSPLLRAQLFERGQEWADKLGAWQLTLAAQVKELEEQLQALDRRWMAAPADMAARREILASLQALYRLFGFFSRWSSQLQERLVRIAV